VTQRIWENVYLDHIPLVVEEVSWNNTVAILPVFSDDNRRLLCSAYIDEKEAALEEFLNKNFLEQGKFSKLGSKWDEPNKLMVTPGRGGKRVGFHIDSLFGKGLGDRRKRPNRFSCNFGPGSRYLLIIPESYLFFENKRTFVDNIGESLFDFFAASPSYQVLCLSIPPGWAYVAPTETVIHDASTRGEKQGCFTTTYVGYYEPWLHNGAYEWSEVQLASLP